MCYETATSSFQCRRRFTAEVYGELRVLGRVWKRNCCFHFVESDCLIRNRFSFYFKESCFFFVKHEPARHSRVLGTPFHYFWFGGDCSQASPFAVKCGLPYIIVDAVNVENAAKVTFSKWFKKAKRGSGYSCVRRNPLTQFRQIYCDRGRGQYLIVAVKFTGLAKSPIWV